MPTYDYECTRCGHSFDAFQSMSDDPLVKCPSCGKNGLKRLIGAGLGIIFKGSGFYATDSRAGGTRKTGSGADASKETGDKKESPSESGTGAKSDTNKTESKAAT